MQHRLKIHNIDETRYTTMDEYDKARYCIYCGKEIKKQPPKDGRYYNEYICDCDDAKKEMELKFKLIEMEREMDNIVENFFPKPKFDFVPVLKEI